MAYVAETHGLSASILSRISEFFGGLAQSVAEARAIERVFNELNDLSQRELDDLGIARSDIPRIARQSVVGE